MFRKTFLGAMIRCVISHMAVSKSMDVNLKRRRKKGGIRIVVFLREEDMMGRFQSEILPIGLDNYPVCVCSFMHAVQETGF